MFGAFGNGAPPQNFQHGGGPPFMPNPGMPHGAPPQQLQQNFVNGAPPQPPGASLMSMLHSAAPPPPAPSLNPAFAALGNGSMPQAGRMPGQAAFSPPGGLGPPQNAFGAPHAFSPQAQARPPVAAPAPPPPKLNSAADYQAAAQQWKPPPPKSSQAAPANVSVSRKAETSTGAAPPSAGVGSATTDNIQTLVAICCVEEGVARAALQQESNVENAINRLMDGWRPSAVGASVGVAAVAVAPPRQAVATPRSAPPAEDAGWQTASKQRAPSQNAAAAANGKSKAQSKNEKRRAKKRDD